MARRIALNALAGSGWGGAPGWSPAKSSNTNYGQAFLWTASIAAGFGLLAYGIKKLSGSVPTPQELQALQNERRLLAPPGIPDEDKGWITWSNIFILGAGTTATYLFFKYARGWTRGIGVGASAGATWLLVNKGEPILGKRTEIVAIWAGFGLIGIASVVASIKMISSWGRRVHTVGVRSRLYGAESKMREASALALSGKRDAEEANELSTGIINKDKTISDSVGSNARRSYLAGEKDYVKSIASLKNVGCRAIPERIGKPALAEEED